MVKKADEQIPSQVGAKSRIDRWVNIRLIDVILKIQMTIAQLLVISVVVIITAEVVSRYFLGQPLGWSVEVSEWALLAITFLGAAIVLRDDGHVRVDVLIRVLPVRARRIVGIFAALIGFGICSLAFYYTAQTAYGEYVQNVLTINVIKFPRFWLLLFFPIGFFFLALEWLRKLIIAIEELITGRDLNTQNTKTEGWG